MNLPEYIRTVGEDVAVKKFGVSVWTIRAWRQQSKFPRTSKAAEIVQLTDGIVDLDGIYTKLEMSPPPVRRTPAAQGETAEAAEVVLTGKPKSAKARAA